MTQRAAPPRPLGAQVAQVLAVLLVLTWASLIGGIDPDGWGVSWLPTLYASDCAEVFLQCKGVRSVDLRRKLLREYLLSTCTTLRFDTAKRNLSQVCPDPLLPPAPPALPPVISLLLPAALRQDGSKLLAVVHSCPYITQRTRCREGSYIQSNSDIELSTFKGLLLGCIEANVCNYICLGISIYLKRRL